MASRGVSKRERERERVALITRRGPENALTLRESSAAAAQWQRSRHRLFSSASGKPKAERETRYRGLIVCKIA